MSRNVKKKRIVKLEPQTVELFAEVLSKLRPPPPLTVSQWADKYRVLSAESSAEPGRWHTEKAPYQRAIMDAIGDPHVRSVVVMSAAQIGKTDAFILNPLGYYMDYAPCPVMCMQPTLDMGQTLSKDRIAPMIRDTPRLTGLVDTKSRYAGNTVMKKNFPGGHITIVGANSPSSLASRPIKVLLADEIDRYPKSAGTEGDPLDLAKKRQTTFWDYKTVINHDQVMELADQINYLGAHYATTAAEIAQTVNDTGSLGQIAGMDVASTAALSTALLAMGVDSGKVATSIRRMYTNLSMGSKATDAQAAAFEQLGFTAEQFAKDMQTDAPAAIKSLFTAIGSQPKDKQVGYLKTLLGQWAIESGAKLTGNLDLFIKTLDDVGDASKYRSTALPETLRCRM